MIKRGHHGSDARDEFTKRTLHGGVDQILASKTPINIEDLLVPEEGSSDPVRFIMVEGPPGIGKSTFAWEVCRRWDEIESLRNHHTVVLLKLREKWVLNATKLSDLFRYPFQPELSQTIAQELHDSNGRKLLFVLDGFDEVSHSFHETSVIKSILCRQLLPECTIILTTRPSAKHTLRSVCQPPVDKHIEIIGFTEEERVRYIIDVFSKQPELQVNFLKYMFLVPHIKSMMYIPLNCAIVAQVYYESQQSSHHLVIPTTTQLYSALINSVLVRYMKTKNTKEECSCMLPEGLNKEDMMKFKILAKFAFDSYHKEKPKKVVFFKEDIPVGLVHFGFMTECTEMYTSKGVEKTFSFLHLSLQEYLAAWHLAHSYSIEFQVAYHWLAVDASQFKVMHRIGLPETNISPYYKGNDEDEKALLASLAQVEESLIEPAVFLAGITELKGQSPSESNHWEVYFSHDTVGITNYSVLLISLYEAQNSNILPYYFNAETSRLIFSIGFETTSSKYFFCFENLLSISYDCLQLSYFLAHSRDLKIRIVIIGKDDLYLVHSLLKYIEEQCSHTIPKAKHFRINISFAESEEISRITLSLLLKSNLLPGIEELEYESICLHSDLTQKFLKSLVKLKSLNFVSKEHSWEWLVALKSLFDLRVLDICSYSRCESIVTPPELLFDLVEKRLAQITLDFELPTDTIYDIRSSNDRLVESLLKSILRSNQITKVCLPSISRETMAGVHKILLQCPKLVSLELRKTRLGYDGILYICSALRNNTSLTHLQILDDPQVPPSRNGQLILPFTSFLSMEKVALPSKTNCTEFLMELNNILMDNSTLKTIRVESELFLQVSASGNFEYCEWTGLGPLQQFNLGAVSSGTSPNLRRSFSSSDLTQPKSLLFWDQQLLQNFYDIDDDACLVYVFKTKPGQNTFSLPSFTAQDTEVLQSFSGLDPRLQQCLGISQEQREEYVRSLDWTLSNMLQYFEVASANPGTEFYIVFQKYHA